MGLPGLHCLKMQKGQFGWWQFQTRKYLSVPEAARTFYTQSPSIFEALYPKLYGFVSKTTHFKKAGSLCTCM